MPGPAAGRNRSWQCAFDFGFSLAAAVPGYRVPGYIVYPVPGTPQGTRRWQGTRGFQPSSMGSMSSKFLQPVGSCPIISVRQISQYPGTRVPRVPGYPGTVVRAMLVERLAMGVR
eukprot:107654-Rhodomonas_salina.2